MKQILTNTGNFNYFKFVTALKHMTYALDIKYASHNYLPVLGRDWLFSANWEITHVNIGNFLNEREVTTLPGAISLEASSSFD